MCPACEELLCRICGHEACSVCENDCDDTECLVVVPGTGDPENVVLGVPRGEELKKTHACVFPPCPAGCAGRKPRETNARDTDPLG
jgi:hypothetical protein